MTTDKLELLAAHAMQRANEDKKLCLSQLSFAVSAFLSLGDYRKAEQAGQLLAFVRRFY